MHFTNPTALITRCLSDLNQIVFLLAFSSTAFRSCSQIRSNSRFSSGNANQKSHNLPGWLQVDQPRAGSEYLLAARITSEYLSLKQSGCAENPYRAGKRIIYYAL